MLQMTAKIVYYYTINGTSNRLLGQTFFIFRLSRIPTVFFQEMEKKNLNLDFFYCQLYENCAESEKTRNKLSKKLYFTVQRTLSVRKEP